jgi:transposase-like protein
MARVIRRRKPRIGKRKLSQAVELELTQRYISNDTTTAELARSYGISESSVWRVAERHGAFRKRSNGMGTV